MKDIAYGTKQIKILNNIEELENVDANDKLVKTTDKRRDSYSFVGFPSSQFMDHQLIANLERGHNIFEIHLVRVKNIK